MMRQFQGKIAWVPLIAESYWKVQVDAISVGDYQLVSSLWAIVDTGTSLIAGPAQQIAQVKFTFKMNKNLLLRSTSFNSVPRRPNWISAATKAPQLKAAQHSILPDTSVSDLAVLFRLQDYTQWEHCWMRPHWDASFSYFLASRSELHSSTAGLPSAGWSPHRCWCHPKVFIFCRTQVKLKRLEIDKIRSNKL